DEGSESHRDSGEPFADPPTAGIPPAVMPYDETPDRDAAWGLDAPVPAGSPAAAPVPPVPVPPVPERPVEPIAFSTPPRPLDPFAPPDPPEAGEPSGHPVMARPRRSFRRTALRVGEELVAWFKTLVSAAVYATLIVTFGFQVARVEGHSMAPTLEDQDRLIVNKVAYRLHDPQVGDIVMLLYPEDPDKRSEERRVGKDGRSGIAH